MWNLSKFVMEEVVIPKDTLRRIGSASELLGVGKQELVDKALLLYLDNLSKFLDLKRELKEWDALSDEALKNFESSL